MKALGTLGLFPEYHEAELAEIQAAEAKAQKQSLITLQVRTNRERLAASPDTWHIVCFSGGEASAIVAVEVARRYGTERLILLNNNISPNVEHESIKQFKQLVADYIGVPITYANMPGWETMDQFDVCVKAGAFSVKTANGEHVICTPRMKSEPFEAYRQQYHADRECLIYYGYDQGEGGRIQKRSSILGQAGWYTDYPLALWANRTLHSIREIGIEPPLTYEIWKHGNCISCLKAGLQHWYCSYVHRYDLYEKGKWAEGEIGNSIHKEGYLEDLEPRFAAMKAAGVPATEHIPSAQFWKIAKERTKNDGATALFCMRGEGDTRPCECVV